MKYSFTPVAATLDTWPPRRGGGGGMCFFPGIVARLRGRPPRGGRGLKFELTDIPNLSKSSPPSRGAWIEIAAHTAPRQSRPSPLRPVCPPGAPSCRPEKSSFVPSVVMYPVSFQLFVSPKNFFADFTWPFFSASTGAFSENCGLAFSPLLIHGSKQMLIFQHLLLPRG